MIRLEMTPSCGAGRTAAVALEHLGEPYAVHVVAEGHFLSLYGVSGPRLVDGDGARPAVLGRDVVRPLVARCVHGASAAAGLVAEHVGARVVPAMLAAKRADAAAPEGARDALRGELVALEALLAVVPRADWASGVMAPVLSPVVSLFRRDPGARAAQAALAARLDEVAASGPSTRAEARIAAARVATPEQVLDFWLGAPIETAEDAMARVRRWFRGGDALDAEVRARFLPTIEAALRGELDGWAATTRGRLALIVVLDQLTRNAFRGDPRTWSGDARALALCTDALDRGLDAELSFVERMFLQMPLQHSEDASVQARYVALARAPRADVAPQFARLVAAQLEQAEKYAAILARFGRFPFRNAVLRRETTAEEQAFLVGFAGEASPRAMREAR